jgi:hypothetical protein
VVDLGSLNRIVDRTEGALMATQVCVGTNDGGLPWMDGWLFLLCALEGLEPRGCSLTVLLVRLNAVRSCTQLPTVAHSSCVWCGRDCGRGRTHQCHQAAYSS